MAVLDGKVALVIGGTRGIGAAISRRLAADGAALAVIYRTRSDEAERFACQLEEASGRVLLLQADVSDPAALLPAIDQALKHWRGRHSRERRRHGRDR